MKKILLVMVMILGVVSIMTAQVIADFEDGTTGPLTLHVQGCGDYDNADIHPVDETFMVVDNPDASGINKSAKVLKFIRRGTDNGGLPWGGFWANVDPNIDVTTNKYAHVMVWKPMISPLKFKLEGTPTLETASMNTQSATGKWVDIVFDFTSLTGPYAVMSLMPDFADPFETAEDIEIYIDNIQFTDNADPIGGDITGMIADFEDGTNGPLTLHVQGCGDYDNTELHAVEETFMVIDNPDASGINTSTKVLKFIRRGTDNGGMPWGGFWANVDPNIDVTTNQYAHVMVWKPMISPLKFKLEGTPTLETASIYDQSDSGKWVDIVFDFTSLTSSYAVMSFMPDFADPFETSEDFEIYIDNIQFTDDPTPIGGGPVTLSVTLSVDMSYQVSLGNFDPEAEYVDVAGSFNNWGDPEGDMLKAGAAHIYSVTLDGFTVDSLLEFKFRINGDWDNSEFPDGGPNRTYTVIEGTNAIKVWYNDEEAPPPAGGIMADFEDGTWGILTPHVMGSGEWDNDALHPVEETFMIVDNPDPSGINTSSKALKFIRRGTDNGGQPWGGFWAQCSPNVDATDSKYVHYMVWKPKISPLKFKLEGGPNGTLEIESMNPQTQTNKWEDIVFDFSTMTGDHPIVALMPDFEDPLEETADIEIYIDNIVINSSPDPNTGIWNNKVESNISMYPNPFTSSINIELTNDMRSVVISNTMGQQVLKIEDVKKGTINIDASILSKGVYIVTLTDSKNKITSAKLLKN